MENAILFIAASVRKTFLILAHLHVLCRRECESVSCHWHLHPTGQPFSTQIHFVMFFCFSNYYFAYCQTLSTHFISDNILIEIFISKVSLYAQKLSYTKTMGAYAKNCWVLQSVQLNIILDSSLINLLSANTKCNHPDANWSSFRVRFASKLNGIERFCLARKKSFTFQKKRNNYCLPHCDYYRRARKIIYRNDIPLIFFFVFFIFFFWFLSLSFSHCFCWRFVSCLGRSEEIGFLCWTASQIITIIFYCVISVDAKEWSHHVESHAKSTRFV